MNEFERFSDNEIITLLLVYHYSYWEDYTKSLSEELKKRNINFTDFDNDENYIKLFIDSFPGGWRNELQKMFKELKNSGWNKSMFLRAKEKWGYFQCACTDSSEAFRQIIEKYEDKINCTCSRCGSKESVQTTGWWVELLCRDCCHDNYRLKGIYDVSKTGFSYRNHYLTDNQFFWKQITKVQFLFNENQQKISIETNQMIGHLYNMGETLEFQLFSNLNFLEFLINVPAFLLDDYEIEKRNNFLNSLKQCYFCSKKTLYLETCLLCRESLSIVLSSRKNKYLKFFNNIAFAIDEQKKETKRFIEYSNDLNFFYNNDYFLD